MKRFLIVMACVLGTMSLVKADDKPITIDQLPQAARTFLNVNFPDDKVSFATKDDDLIRPDYDVRLSNGTELEFDYAGELKKVSSREGVLEELIPDGIRKYVAAHYPKAGYREYEVGKRSYEVKLTNGMELKFNTNFILIEIDD